MNLDSDTDSEGSTSEEDSNVSYEANLVVKEHVQGSQFNSKRHAPSSLDLTSNFSGTNSDSDDSDEDQALIEWHRKRTLAKKKIQDDNDKLQQHSTKKDPQCALPHKQVMAKAKNKIRSKVNSCPASSSRASLLSSSTSFVTSASEQSVSKAQPTILGCDHSHPIRGGRCSGCGEAVNATHSAYGHDKKTVVLLTEAGARRLQGIIEKRLLREKKLILALDLDATVIHTTMGKK